MTPVEPSRPGVVPRVLAVVGVAVAGALVGVAVVAAASAAGLRPGRHPGLSPLVTVSYAVVGTLLGAFAWYVVRRRARRPRTVLGWSVAAVAAVSLGADVVAGASGRWLAGLAAAAQHVVVIAATVAVLWWAMPVPPDDEAGDAPGWASGLRRPVRVLLAVVLVVGAAGWVMVNKAVEGPILLEITSRHGLTTADLLSVAALVTAGQLLRPVVR